MSTQPFSSTIEEAKETWLYSQALLLLAFLLRSGYYQSLVYREEIANGFAKRQEAGKARARQEFQSRVAQHNSSSQDSLLHLSSAGGSAQSSSHSPVTGWMNFNLSA